MIRFSGCSPSALELHAKFAMGVLHRSLVLFVALQETLDSMAVKLEACRTKWSNESVSILKKNMQLLQEFGLVSLT